MFRWHTVGTPQRPSNEKCNFLHVKVLVQARRPNNQQSTPARDNGPVCSVFFSVENGGRQQAFYAFGLLYRRKDYACMDGPVKMPPLFTERLSAIYIKIGASSSVASRRKLTGRKPSLQEAINAFGSFSSPL